MFITIEGETGTANLIVWPKIFELHRRIVLGGSIMSIYGKLQREGEVVHLIASSMTDMIAELATVGANFEDLRDAFFSSIANVDCHRAPKGLDMIGRVL